MKINYYFPDFSFIKKNIKSILAIAALYLFFLVVNIPASIVFSNINLPKNISIGMVSGTVWSGGIEQIKVSSIDLGKVTWRLSPLSFLFGELSVDISLVNNKQFLNSKINISYSGKIKLEETRFSVNLSLFSPLTYGMPFAYAGQASGYFPVSFFHKNNFIGLNGKLSLANIRMISPQEQLFGDFVVDFRAEKEGATSGKIKDLDANLNISGQLNLKKNGQVKLSAKLAAREAGSSLEKMLSFLGQKDASGQIQLNSTIKLWH